MSDLQRRTASETTGASGLYDPAILQEALHKDLEPLVREFRLIGIGLRGTDVEKVLRAAVAQQGVEEHAAALTKLRSAISPATARAVQAGENTARAIEAEFGLLSASAVAELLGSKGPHRSLAGDLRKRGQLLYLPRLNSFVYPGFQFDSTRGRIRPFVAPLLSLAMKCDWDVEDVVRWMVAPTTYLQGRRPVDHVDDPNLILATAQQAWTVEW
jgi:hypothetical protein